MGIGAEMPRLQQGVGAVGMGHIEKRRCQGEKLVGTQTSGVGCPSDAGEPSIKTAEER